MNSILNIAAITIFLIALIGIGAALFALANHYDKHIRKRMKHDGTLNKSQEQIVAEEAARLKAYKHAQLLKVEAARTTREQYEMRKISGWMFIGPVIGFLIGGMGLSPSRRAKGSIKEKSNGRLTFRSERRSPQ